MTDKRHSAEKHQPSCETEPSEADQIRLRLFVRALKHAHTIDIKVRQDGVDYWLEGDWLKYLNNYFRAARLQEDSNPTQWQRFWRRVWWYTRLMPWRRERKEKT